jgi:hypothetical protein
VIAETYNPKRCGIITRGLTLPEWQARCIRGLREHGVEIVLLVQETSAGEPAGGKGVLWPWLLKRFFRPAALRPVPAASLFEGVPVLAAGPRLSAADRDRVRRLDLDFFLHFGSPDSLPELADLADDGVWSFVSGEPTGFWEIYSGAATTAVVLQQTSGKGPPAVLRRGVFKTVEYSYAQTVNGALLQAATWPALACPRLGEAVLAAPGPALESPTRRAPGALQALRLLGKLLKNALRLRVYAAFFRHPVWNIGVVREPIQAFLRPGYRPTIRWLPEPEDGTFIADPFAVRDGDRLGILYEEFSFATWKGRICCVQVVDGLPLSPARVALETPVHMSYPYLLEHGGEVYCIPETHEAAEAALYRAVQLPDRWERVATLLRGLEPCDSTLFRHDGRWWLLCTDYRNNSNLNLYAWHAPDLLGPWEPHAQNPIKTDVSSARPAGTPFVHEGVLYRPAQDSSRRYGGRLVIHRVLRLTPTEFAEEPAVVLEPDRHGRYRAGLHTLSAVGGYTLVDGLRYTFSLRSFLAILRRRAAKVMKGLLRLGRRSPAPTESSPLPPPRATREEPAREAETALLENPALPR